MNREAVLFLVAGVGCVAVFGAIAGAPGSPAVAGGAYEVTVPADDLFTHPTPNEDAESVSQVEVFGLEVDAAGQPGWLGPVGIVVVLGAWLLVAFRIVGAPGVLFLLLAVGAALAAFLFVGLGGTQAAAPAANQRLTDLDKLVGLLVALVTVASGVVLFLPDDADAYVADVRLLGPIREALSDLVGDLRRRAPAVRATPPDDEVHRRWWQLARRYGADAGGRDWTSLTPGEVARAARRHDAPTDAVADLREVFEHARYDPGGPPADAAARARDAWERIEAADGAGTATRPGAGPADERGSGDA